MKVRIIRQPHYTALHHVQVKRLWWPFWVTVYGNDLSNCEQAAQNLIENKRTITVVMEGKSK